MEYSDKLKAVPERSEPVREILGREPRWMVRWGTILVLGVVGVLGYLSWAVHYPEVLKAPILLTSEDPPVDVYARSSGRLDRLFVRDSQYVDMGEPLCLLDNPAKWENVLLLKAMLDSLRGSHLYTQSSTLEGELPPTLSLGNMQEAYGQLVEAWVAYKAYFRLNPLTRRRVALRQNLYQQHSILNEYESQIQVLRQISGLSKNEFERYKSLFLTEAVSRTQLEEKERAWLLSQRDVDAIKARIAEVQLQILELESELLQLQLQQPDLEIRLQERFSTNLDQLYSRYQSWEQQYVLKAPKAGSVSFFKFWSPNQFVQKEEPVLTIIPTHASPILGKVRLPVLNSGKVQVGQKVYIFLDNYPFQEYGVLEGIIDRISQVPREATYAIDVSLPKGMQTHHKLEIPFRQELQGTAEIITEDMRLIERLLYQLRKALRNR